MQKLDYVEKPHLKIIFFDKGYITQERGGFKKLKNSAEMCTRGEELQFTFTIYSERGGGGPVKQLYICYSLPKHEYLSFSSLMSRKFM